MNLTQKDLQVIKDALKAYIHESELDVDMDENIGTAYEYPYTMVEAKAVEKKVKYLDSLELGKEK
jgi:hypothetical protein